MNKLLQRSCKKCDKQFNLKVDRLDYHDWVSGAYVQDAFPYLTTNEREILVSGICGQCFDNMFEGNNE